MNAPATGPLWGIGQYHDGTARRPWPISSDEMHRDMGHATTALADLGVGVGDRVLVCSMLSESGQFWPFMVAALLNRAPLSCTDATAAEARRLALFLRLLEYRVVLGVNDELLDGLDELDVTYEEAFAGVGVVAARPGAYGRLARAGLAPHRFAMCGPAVAIGRRPDEPARVAAEEWQLDTDGDRVVVTARQPRATTFHRTPTAVIGSIDDDGVIPKAGKVIYPTAASRSGEERP